MTQEAITSYDAMGREVSSTDQNTGEVTTTTYDFMGRVVKTERSLTDQEGNKTSQTETKSYNANVQPHQTHTVQGYIRVCDRQQKPSDYHKGRCGQYDKNNRNFVWTKNSSDPYPDMNKDL